MTIVRVAAVQFAVTEDVDGQPRHLPADDRPGRRRRAPEVVVLPEFCNHVSWYDDREHARRMAVTLDGAVRGGAGAPRRPSTGST